VRCYFSLDTVLAFLYRAPVSRTSARKGRTMKIVFFAAAENSKGKIEQLRVTRENGRPVAQQWTGKTYESMEECEADLRALNCR
jgi:hypothetical protein